MWKTQFSRNGLRLLSTNSKLWSGSKDFTETILQWVVSWSPCQCAYKFCSCQFDKAFSMPSLVQLAQDFLLLLMSSTSLSHYISLTNNGWSSRGVLTPALQYLWCLSECHDSLPKNVTTYPGVRKEFCLIYSIDVYSNFWNFAGQLTASKTKTNF